MKKHLDTIGFTCEGVRGDYADEAPSLDFLRPDGEGVGVEVEVAPRPIDPVFHEGVILVPFVHERAVVDDDAPYG